MKIYPLNKNNGRILQMRRINPCIPFLFFMLVFLSACHPVVTAPIPYRGFPTLQSQNAESTATPPPTMVIPTHTPTSPQPTPTIQPIELSATVWEALPQTPILMYHRFNPAQNASSSAYMTTLADFDKQLHALYHAGYSLVSLNDWLRGEIHVPEGRKPLIITIDDLFYADQISLDESGEPAAYSGLGHLWHFYQDHPEFSFKVALFYNMGDKGYLNHYTNGSFSAQPGWREDRARAIAWGIENGAIPLNHFYEHPFLDSLSPQEIHWQMEENDRALRETLALIGKESLAKDLPNILALPYVIWPKTPAGRQILYDYTSPDGAPVAAIMEGGYHPQLFPAPFSPDFDPWHVPRANASPYAIQAIADFAESLPSPTTCDLGKFPDETHMNAEPILKSILNIVNAGHCPYGYYIVGQLAFHVHENGIIQLSP